MEYRNDLEAARLRINTLEAKLDESKASLEARDAELAECRVERDRLRQTPGAKASQSKWLLIGVAAVAFGIGSVLSFGAGTMFGFASPPIEPSTQTAAPPIQTITENGTRVEGAINRPKEEPLAPNAKAEGQVPAPEPLTSAATVAGQTNDPTAEGPTIESVVESARPKIRECFREERKQHPKASGSVTVQFDIEPSGKVSRVKLETYRHVEPWWSKTFDTCAVGVYRNLTFPNTAGPKTTASGKYFLSSLDNELGF